MLTTIFLIPIGKSIEETGASFYPRKLPMLRQSFTFLACTALWFFSVGCQTKNARLAALPAAVEVGATAAVTQSLIDYREFTGRTSAVNSVDVRARVSGYLLQSPQAKTTTTSSSAPPLVKVGAAQLVTVNEGDLITQGTHLFQIDPQPYELALEQAKGSLAAAEARLKQAIQDLKRMECLKENAVSQAEVDQAVAAVAEVQGQIQSLQSVVARTELDLSYTRVESPIAGLLGARLSPTETW